MNERVLIELHFLPSIEYFCAIRNSNEIQIERCEHFVKQSYRNRCYIKTSQGVQMLNVPLSNKSGKTNITDIRIDNSFHWKNQCWRTLESSYRNSPYFEHYADKLKQIIYSGKIFLFDLNVELLSLCLSYLKWDKRLTFTTSYNKMADAAFFDLRSVVTNRETWPQRPIYQAISYQQVFGNSFDENLSLVDLLFCVGPEAGKIVAASLKTFEQNNFK
jgi:hypothetical protein